MDAKTIDNRIRRAFNGIRQAFRGKIARVKAAGGVQQIQVEGLEGETVQDLEHAENFGFTSNPPAGSDCVVVPLGGKTSHGIIVTTTNGAYRITGLAEGETAVYNADGAKMVLKKDSVFHVQITLHFLTLQEYAPRLVRDVCLVLNVFDVLIYVLFSIN